MLSMAFGASGPEGRETQWNDRGVKTLERCYVKGMLDGLELNWDDEGRPRSADTWKAGKREGAAARWKDSKQVEAIRFEADKPAEAYLRREDRVLHVIVGQPAQPVEGAAFPEWSEPKVVACATE